MATVGEIFEKILPGLISGSATAMGTIYGYLTDLKTRLAAVETRIGKVDPDTGAKSGLLSLFDKLSQRIDGIEREVKLLAEAVKSWEGHSSSRGAFTSTDLSMIEGRIHAAVLEDIKNDHRQFRNRLNELQSDIERLQERLQRCLTVENAQVIDQAKTRELDAIRQELASLRGKLSIIKTMMDAALKLPR